MAMPLITTGLYKIAQLKSKFWLRVGYAYSDSYYLVDKVTDGLTSIEIHSHKTISVNIDFETIRSIVVSKTNKRISLDSCTTVNRSITVYNEFPKKELTKIKRFIKKQQKDLERELKQNKKIQDSLEAI